MKNKIIEFANLEKWQATLANCIRCGYCFEHCPMFKYSGWESDAPRAKIITAFGLLSSEIEPSESVADKMFSCFFCKRCEAACSSGVPLTKIFIDARKDLAEIGFDGPGTTSTTKPDCVRCLICVDACPHEARFYDKKDIAVDPAKCESCGICIEACPAGAAIIKNDFGTNRSNMVKQAALFLDTHKSSKAIVFACNWSFYPDLQASILPETQTEDNNYEILVNMCGGRIEHQLLMAPFLHDAWGVMVACCPDDQCDHNGNLRAKKIVKTLQDTFKTIDINPERINLVEIPAGDKTLFQAKIDTFIARLFELGPVR